jgi:hypothetical protein
MNTTRGEHIIPRKSLELNEEDGLKKGDELDQE